MSLAELSIYETKAPETEISRDLLLAELRDLRDAERQLVEALPKMAGPALSTELKEAFTHQLEYEDHPVATQLEKIVQNPTELLQAARGSLD